MESICYDKKEIALAIRNSTLEQGMDCSILSEGVVKECFYCGLNSICRKLDKICDEYTEENIKVISSFTF